MNVSATVSAPVDTDADTIAIGVFDGKGVAHDVDDGALQALLDAGEARTRFRHLAVTHAAWCFDKAGRRFDPALAAALLEGYAEGRALSREERAALPILARGAALRFTLTRAYDWANTPADALVTRKDPMAFARRLAFYADPANAGVFA